MAKNYRTLRAQRNLPMFLGGGRVHSSIKECYAFLRLLSKHESRKELFLAHCCTDVEENELSLCVYVSSNTAQLLSELGHSKDSTTKVTKLEEALWLFDLCLQRQLRHFDLYSEAAKAGNPIQLKHAASEPLAEDVQMSDGPAEGTSLPAGEKTEVYARLVEPTTKDTILDTIIAQLATLTQLIEETPASNPDSKTISLLRSYFKNNISKALERFSPYLGYPHHGPSPLIPDHSLSPREDDMKLALSNYECSLANFRFHTNELDIAQYESIINSSYGFDMSSTPQALCDAAESLVDFHDAIAQLGTTEPYISQRWKVLSHALDFLAMAVKLPSCENKENIYAKRGDVELLRFQLGRAGIEFRVAVRDRDTILKNAGKFYRGAAVFAEQGDEKAREKMREVEIKGALVEALLGDRTKLVALGEKGGEFGQVVGEAFVDGCIVEEQVEEFELEKYI